MIDYSLIRLIPADKSHREFSYQVKKAAEGEYITQIWGWGENIQRDFHAKAWQRKRPEVITCDNKPIGTMGVIENEDYIEIVQFFLLPDYQNKGIGTYLLKRILDKADDLERVVKLAFLKNNPVKSLYVRNGFQTVQVDERFYYMERKPSGGASMQGV
jgi:GNAT superfamily N-acetyltransferase